MAFSHRGERAPNPAFYFPPFSFMDERLRHVRPYSSAEGAIEAFAPKGAKSLYIELQSTIQAEGLNSRQIGRLLTFTNKMGAINRETPIPSISFEEDLTAYFNDSETRAAWGLHRVMNKAAQALVGRQVIVDSTAVAPIIIH